MTLMAMSFEHSCWLAVPGRDSVLLYDGRADPVPPIDALG